LPLSAAKEPPNQSGQLKLIFNGLKVLKKLFQSNLYVLSLSLDMVNLIDRDFPVLLVLISPVPACFSSHFFDGMSTLASLSNQNASKILRNTK